MPPTAKLWRCPQCDARFTTRRQWHSCGRFGLAPLFARSEPVVRQLYEAVLARARACGPLTVIPQKSRIALQVRMRFAAFMPLRSSLKGHLVLAERHPARCFERIETFSPRNHVHVFRLGSLAELTPELASFVRAAYQVGRQEHRAAAPGQGTKAQRGSEARGSSGATRQAGRRAG